MSKSIRKSASLTDSEFSAQAPIALGRRFYQIAVAAVAEVHAPIGLTPLEFAVLIHLRCAWDRPEHACGADGTGPDEHGCTCLSAGAATFFEARCERGRSARTCVAPHCSGTSFARQAASQGTCCAGATTGRAGASEERRSLVDLLRRVIDANPTYVRPGAGRRPRHKQ